MNISNLIFIIIVFIVVVIASIILNAWDDL
jgi:hypothetical protein